MTESTSPNAKVAFRVPQEGEAPIVETLWATSLGNDHFRLDNSPFYAYEVSWQDEVHAPLDVPGGQFTFSKVTSKSGNRTVRVIVDPPFEEGNASAALIDGLVALGCSYEGATRRLFSINVPKDVPLQNVRHYLIERNANWEHADPTYEQLFPGED